MSDLNDLNNLNDLAAAAASATNQLQFAKDSLQTVKHLLVHTASSAANASASTAAPAATSQSTANVATAASTAQQAATTSKATSAVPLSSLADTALIATDTSTAHDTDPNTDPIHDAIIIGSGPAGYTAAIYLARAGYAPLVIAGALTPGGQLVNTTEVENYPGFPDGIMGPDLMDAMQRQAEKFGATVEWDDVIAVDLSGAVKTLTLDGGAVLRARSVIIATGSAVRKLGVPGEEEFSGRGVSYCATCDGFFFKGKPIVVVGGGDSAFEEADFLSRYGESVTLIHRRHEFRASKIMVDRARANDAISFMLDAVVERVHGDATGATAIDVRNVLTHELTQVPVKGLFVAIGHTPNTAFLNGALELDAQGYIQVDGSSTRTSLAGVFAAGDVVDSVYRQAISAAGMGCRAALDAQAYLEQYR